MFDKLTVEEHRYEDLMRLLGTTEVQSDPSEYRKHAKALADVEPLVQRFREYKAIVRDLTQAEELAASGDPDMRELAKEEIRSLTARRDTALADLKVLLIPKDPNDEKNVVLEIRAGTGGDEAALFAGDLFRMYSKFAERLGWRLEVMSSNETAVGITHLPTGLVVSQQDEKSQIKNRAKAMKVLRARLYEIELRKQQEAIAKDRRSQVGTGERSEKIRTYNYRENRITDHRVNFTTHRLADVLNGDLTELLEHVITHYQSEKLKDATAVS